ncbi:DUF2306 domain-containing protein [Nocardia sp. CA-128927]|uniref:DUF2306 domain-containing protein n=1 Tax=Nocardia sp. CA-128927 TaxID=3239975 RepID=UPI003D991375
MSRLRIQVTLWSIVAIGALAYAPLAIEYAWKDFVPASPRLQNVVASGLVSDDFALGPESVEASQGAAYHDARIALLAHTTFGALAMLACLVQFSRRIRERHWQLHRRLGKITLGSVAISMVAGAVLLAQAPPNSAHLGWLASTIQLIGLNVLTSGSAILAYLAIRGGDVRAHRAWMMFMFAMLLSAPLLRLSWFVLGNVFPWMNELMALRLGTVVLVLLTPAGAIAARALSDRPATPPGTPPTLVVHPGIFGVVVVAGVANTILVIDRMNGLNTTNDTAWTVIRFLPIAALLAWFGVAAWRTHRAGEFIAAQDWQIFFLSMCAAPIALNVLWSLVAPFVAPAEAYLIAGMMGASAPLFTAYLMVVMRHATFWQPLVQRLRPARTPLHTPDALVDI